MTPSRFRSLSVLPLATCAMALVLGAGLSVPAMAQQAGDNRIEKLEAEVRALQRKVFPGGDSRYFTPEITAPAPSSANGSAATVPTSTAMSNVLVRMDSVELQVQRLTAQVEQLTNRQNQLEAKIAAMLPGASAATAPAAEPGPGGAPASGPAVVPAVAPPAQAPAAAPRPAAQPATALKPIPSPPPAKTVATPASAARIAAVKQVVKPQTDDPGDDEYSYGYRLWEAKFYPEAEQQLQSFLQKYPKHRRAGWGRNLLGRAYLDDGNPTEAAKWFWQNYLADKRGDRAPDSLLYLAVAMKQLKDTSRTCIALAEFGETYAAEAAGRLKSLYDATRSGVSCS